MFTLICWKKTYWEFWARLMRVLIFISCYVFSTSSIYYEFDILGEILLIINGTLLKNLKCKNDTMTCIDQRTQAEHITESFIYENKGQLRAGIASSLKNFDI